MKRGNFYVNVKRKKDDWMQIAVYLGSARGNDPAFAKAAYELGAWIAKRGHTLVFGGSDRGTMGDLARGALEHGGKVIGVIPQFMIDKHWEMEGLTETIVVNTMAERREKMIELADAFVTLPGGMGTLDEISEVLSGIRLGLIHGAVCFLNINGYYDALRDAFLQMQKAGFISEQEFGAIQFVTRVRDLLL